MSLQYFGAVKNILKYCINQMSNYRFKKGQEGEDIKATKITKKQIISRHSCGKVKCNNLQRVGAVVCEMIARR